MTLLGQSLNLWCPVNSKDRHAIFYKTLFCDSETQADRNHNISMIPQRAPVLFSISQRRPVVSLCYTELGHKKGGSTCLSSILTSFILRAPSNNLVRVHPLYLRFYDVVFSHSNTPFLAQLFQKISKDGQYRGSSDDSSRNFCLRARS
jgi:hypothetical protein